MTIAADMRILTDLVRDDRARVKFDPVGKSVRAVECTITLYGRKAVGIGPTTGMALRDCLGALEDAGLI
jgi:hypothetical protein